MTDFKEIDLSFPIFTVKNDCQDCYKCVRACPVKAIKIENGHAQEISDYCVLCGRCVEICPVGAKRIREDLPKAVRLIKSGKPVYASIAPSWVGEFPGISSRKIIRALKMLGFAEIGETALGAQEVTASLAGLLKDARPGLYLSTACPSAVEYVRRYLPHLTNCLTPVLSPLLAHCKLIRQVAGPNATIVFFGPCIAKKVEADGHGDILACSLTFKDLRAWLEDAGIELDRIEEGPDDFFPVKADEGTHYPIEGGMIETIKASGEFPNVRFLTISGMNSLKRALDNADPENFTVPVFMECLACPGGCINGPGSEKERSSLSRWMEVKDFAGPLEEAPKRRATVSVNESYPSHVADEGEVTEEQIELALKLIGKTSVEDELNCGGCGYDTCRSMAKALILGRAEVTMCVSYMRKKAQKKANALLRSMPSGVVIVDQELKIVECNERFATLMGPDTLTLYEISEGLKGAKLDRIAPAFSHLVEGVLETDQDVHYDHFRAGEKLFEITVFTIEPRMTVGAVILDVTRRELRRDQIAHRANEVIRKNLVTVQEIACRLGEHMADTEILLRDIAEGYGSESDPGPETERKGH